MKAIVMALALLVVTTEVGLAGPAPRTPLEPFIPDEHTLLLYHSGRQFMVGMDVGFHFDSSGGRATSLSIYNEGGRVKNVDGLPHQHLGTSLGAVRAGKWHHCSATYDGSHIAFFFDGALVSRVEAAKDFLLGVPSRGFWVGCYVGDDFWFSSANPLAFMSE